MTVAVMEGRPAALRALAAGLLGPGVGVGACAVGAGGALLGQERAAAARMVPARRAEFAAGREAARAALTMIGHPAGPIPMGPERAPVWPDGITGTITHAGGIALAAVAPASTVRALGMDLEPAAPLEADLWPGVLLDEEVEFLRTVPAGRRGIIAKQLFCMKESVYKAQFSCSGVMLDFHDLAIVPVQAPGHFQARFRRPAPPFAVGDVLPVMVREAAGMILAASCLPVLAETGCFPRIYTENW